MDEKQKHIIQSALSYVNACFEHDTSGHDHHHMLRVYHTALRIAEAEGADTFIVSLAALLHDVDDEKLTGIRGSTANAESWMQQAGVPHETQRAVVEIIHGVSFKGAGVSSEMPTLEGRCVQDADRLDAIGAIGIARAFAYGGSRGREMHNPETPPVLHVDEAQYRAAKGTSLNHFYEKLLLLKDLMGTETGRKMAEHRHAYLQGYLEEFLAEWEGKL